VFLAGRRLIPVGGRRDHGGCVARDQPMENRRGHQSQKIACLEDGLRDQDRQRGVQKAEAAADGNDDRNKQQKRYKQQHNS